MSRKYKFGDRSPVACYLHENPERTGFVKHPIDCKHSSAIDYYTEEAKGFLELVRLD